MFLALPLVAACSGEPDAIEQPDCAHPATYDLGALEYPEVRTTFRTSGGDLYFGIGVSDDGVISIRQTRVFLGQVGSPPRMPLDGGYPTNASASVRLRVGNLTKADLPAGRYRVIATNGGKPWIEAGAPTTIRVAHPSRTR